MIKKALPAVSADILAFILFAAVIAPFYSDLFTSPSVRGGSFLFLGFLLVAFGVNWIKRMEPLEPKEGHIGRWLDRIDFTGNQRTMIILAVAAVAVFALIQVEMNDIWGDTVDLFENTGEVHEGEMTLYITFGPIFIWFIAGALYVIGFALPTSKVIEAGTTAYAVTEFGVLLLTNLLIGMYALYFAGWIGRMLPAAGPVLTFLLTLAILELLFVPLRLRHTFKNPLTVGLVSFFVMLVAIVGFATI